MGGFGGAVLEALAAAGRRAAGALPRAARSLDRARRSRPAEGRVRARRRRASRARCTSLLARSAEERSGSTSGWSRDGLAETRSQAEALILAGRVLVDDAPGRQAGHARARRRRACACAARRRVSFRAAARSSRARSPTSASIPAGKRCLDVGASTGGFTDCLLAAGARRVVAVDVGYGQLAPRLRDDPRVVVLERRNARALEPARRPGADRARERRRLVHLGAPAAAGARRASRPRADWLVLVKPQFEVGKGRVGKGGVVRDDALRARGGPRRPRGCRGARARGASGRPRAGSRGPRAIARCSCIFVRGLRPRRAPRRALVDSRAPLLSYACSPERFPWP